MAGKYTSHHAEPPNKPGVNWVEKKGGLPGPINATMRALMAKGWDQQRAVATAVSQIKAVCATGRAFGGKVPVSAEARAKACAAAAQWELMKGSASIPNETLEAIEMSTAPDPASVVAQLAVANPAVGRALGRRLDMAATQSVDMAWGPGRIKGEDGPAFKPSDTSNHAAAGLRRLGANVYVDGKGKTFKRVGKGTKSSFAPLSAKEKKAVKKAVKAKGYGKAKVVEMALPLWNPADHPRDPIGRFAARLGELSRGELVKLPDVGTPVQVQSTRGEGFDVLVGGGKERRAVHRQTAVGAAETALEVQRELAAKSKSNRLPPQSEGLTRKQRARRGLDKPEANPGDVFDVIDRGNPYRGLG